MSRGARSVAALCRGTKRFAFISRHHQKCCPNFLTEQWYLVENGITFGYLMPLGFVLR